jgi:excisionase family DNA binding protein
MSNKEELITAPEMAERLGVGEATIYRYITSGRIPATRRRWGLRHRYEVLRADFERVAPGLAGDDTIGKSGRRKPGHEAIALSTS